MRRYFFLSIQAYGNFRKIVAYEGRGVVSRLNIFRDGLPFEGEIPTELKFYISDGPHCDYLPNGFSWPIVSNRLLEVIQRFSSDFQVFQPPLFSTKTNERVSDYKILNVTRVLDAWDEEKSRANHFRPVLHEKMIPSDVHIFRPVGREADIVVSGELARAMKGIKAGVALIKTTVVGAQPDN